MLSRKLDAREMMSIFEDTKLNTLARRPTAIRSARAVDEAVVVAAAVDRSTDHTDLFVGHTFLHMHHSLAVCTHSHRIHLADRRKRYGHKGLVYAFGTGFHNHTPIQSMVRLSG